jgi:hypothetical protein
LDATSTLQTFRGLTETTLLHSIQSIDKQVLFD